MTRTVARPLSAEAFAPYGDVLEVSGAPDMLINREKCGRFHDLAALDFGPNGRVGISLFQAELYPVPHVVDLLERHPLGSQAFLPMGPGRYLVVVAGDLDGMPGRPLAFVAGPGQGVNIHRNVWHGVLTPIEGSGTFAVVDRIGEAPNLEEFTLPQPVEVRLE